MPLTPAEKLAGRAFVASEQEKLTASFQADPPTYKAPNFLSHWRHECPGTPNNISTAIELKERYLLSPAFLVNVERREVVPVFIEPVSSEEAVDADYEYVPAARLGFIYKEGQCKSKGCGHTARSLAGKVVDAYERPPIEGRVARVGR